MSTTATAGAAPDTARESAAAGAARAASQGSRKYLSFTLNGEIYAMAIDQVKEIIEFGQITTVPMMPAYMRGVINLRGAVVPVIDLSRRFGGDASEIGRRTCIVILELHESDGERQVIGIVVDAVNAVMDIAPEAIEPPPSFGTRVRPDFILGMGRVRERFVVILNVQRTLSIDELGAIGELAATA